MRTQSNSGLGHFKALVIAAEIALTERNNFGIAAGVGWYLFNAAVNAETE